MSLYKGTKKAAGNITYENIGGNLGNHPIIFDDSGNADEVESFSSIANQISSKRILSSLTALIKTGPVYLNNQIISINLSLINKLDVSAFNNHMSSSDHDNRYYTEAEIDARLNNLNSNKLDVNTVTTFSEVSPTYSNHGIVLIWGDDGYLYVKVDKSYVAMIKGWTKIR